MSSHKNIKALQKRVWDYYQAHGRHDLPWRIIKGHDPYKIIVSELMLQQTQVARVIPKFTEFIATFPSFAALGQASLADVLKAWNGLGYNRRAKFLHQLAQTVQEDFGGKLPAEKKALIRLPGIGPNTAGAVMAYAFNGSAVFVETNIRSVFIHHFFPNSKRVTDQELLPLIEQAGAGQDPRTWYWALMDYGVFIKSQFGNTARASAHHTKQSRFEGSRRQIRGQVLRELAKTTLTTNQLQKIINDERLEAVLNDLRAEGFINKQGTHFYLHI